MVLLLLLLSSLSLKAPGITGDAAGGGQDMPAMRRRESCRVWWEMVALRRKSRDEIQSLGLGARDRLTSYDDQAMI